MNQKKVNIYLVDDDRIFSVIAKVTLSKLYDNIRFVHLANGKEALHTLTNCQEEDKPALLFLDINMPIMDGWEFLKTLESSNQFTFPVCMTSSSIDPEDRKMANEHPYVIDFVEKPFDVQKIRELIDPLITQPSSFPV